MGGGARYYTLLLGFGSSYRLKPKCCLRGPGVPQTIFFFRKHIAREGLALYCTMVRTIGANRDVLLKIVTKLPAGGVPNDVKVKTLLRQSLRSS